MISTWVISSVSFVMWRKATLWGKGLGDREIDSGISGKGFDCAWRPLAHWDMFAVAGSVTDSARGENLDPIDVVPVCERKRAGVARALSTFGVADATSEGNVGYSCRFLLSGLSPPTRHDIRPLRHDVKGNLAGLAIIFVVLAISMC